MPGGRDLTELFSASHIDAITQESRRRGRPYNLSFAKRKRLSNSRLALEAAEFARDHGRYTAMHTGLFKAFFTHGKDIGDREVLSTLAAQSGLDPVALGAALTQNTYTGRVLRGSESARENGITAVPAFVLKGHATIPGAIEEEDFRRILINAGASPTNI